MGIKTEFFGKMDDGRDILLYTLSNENGLTASFTNLGATWVSMMVPDQDGNFKDVILGYENADGYKKNGPHFGAPIGRNSNRISKASFTLKNQEYQLKKNNGDNNLHSGDEYYHDRIWEVNPADDELGSSIVFSLMSPDGDQGFPGNLEIAMKYTLSNDDSLIIDYNGVSDEDTVFNMTNHCYFNLAGHNSGSVLSHTAWIDGDGFTVSDEELIPTGEIAKVAGTPMDFRTPKTLGQDIDADYIPLIFAGGYDHNYVLNVIPNEITLAAFLKDEKSGRKMEVYTDLPGVQLYTANFLTPFAGCKENASYNRRCAVCFETQFFPSALTIAGFRKPIIKAGEHFKTTTIYKFLVDES